MGERPTIAFRVDESQKEDWEEYARENEEYDSLSHLIRVAVAHEMSDAYGPLGRTEDGDGGQGSEKVGELVTTVNKMQARLEELEDTVASATDAMYSADAGSDDLSTAVFSELPENEENAESASEIARRLGLEAVEVRGTLEQLREQTGVVRRVEPQVTGRSEHIYYKVN